MNLEEHKIDLLRLIKKKKKFIVIATDKNLGPVIMEIEYYIHRCLIDHLDNTDTYKLLPETEARQINVDNFRFICEHFIDNPKANLTKQARDFFVNNCIGFRNSDNNSQCVYGITFPYFYMMPKVNKKPDWKTRPVVSGVTSIMRPLSIWLDAMLQSVVHLCPSYLKDSWNLLNDLRKFKKIKKQKIIILDANAFYTNINTQHAIDVLERWFLLHSEELPKNFPVDLILLGIRRLMEFNLFEFDSRYYLQLNGTAMGTNVACMWATIYYSYYEETKLCLLPFMSFHRRLIDNALMIVDKDVNISKVRTHMNAFRPVGKYLTWETNEPKNTVNFLDLSITISANGTITTKTYQKEDNKYLYSTPDSCQPKINIKNFVYGTLHCCFWQKSKLSDYNHFTKFLFDNMLNQGHIKYSLKKIFQKQSRKAQQSNLPNITRYPKHQPPYLLTTKPQNHRKTYRFTCHTTQTIPPQKRSATSETN